MSHDTVLDSNDIESFPCRHVPCYLIMRHLLVFERAKHMTHCLSMVVGKRSPALIKVIISVDDSRGAVACAIIIVIIM
jgi:hypothetical protein